MQTAYTDFRLNGTDLAFWLSGSGPVLIRSLIPEILLYGAQDKEGQV